MDDDDMFLYDQFERREQHLHDIETQLRQTTHLNSSNLNVLLKLDTIFMLDNKQRLYAFIHVLNHIHSNMISKHSNLKRLYEETIIVRFRAELDRISQTENQTQFLEDHHYLSLITMFYIVSKYQIDITQTSELIMQIFKLHKPRMPKYFETLYSIFKKEIRKDLCSFLRNHLQKYTNISLDVGFNALIVLAYFNQSNFVDVSDLHLNTSTKANELINVLEYYYDFFSQAEDMGALFMNYVSIYSKDIQRVYFNGHIGYLDFFPLRSYLKFIQLWSIKKDTKNDLNEIILFMEAILNHLASNYVNLYQNDQLNLCSCINETLNSLISNQSQQTRLITHLIELNLKIIFTNGSNTPFINENNSDHSSLNYDQTSFKSFHSFYRTLIDLIRKWLKVECCESLLINYGLEQVTRRMFSPIGLSSEAMMDIDIDQHDAYHGTSDEAKLYNSLFNLNLPQKSSITSTYLNINVYHEDLFSLFKDRFQQRIDYSFKEIVEFKSKFDFFKNFNPKSLSDKISSIFDSVLINNLKSKPDQNNLDILCKKLMSHKLSELKIYISKLLNDKWCRQSGKLLKFTLTWPVYLNIYLNHIDSNDSIHPMSILKQTINYSDSEFLLDAEWNRTYIESFDYLIRVFSQISEGSALIEDIKLVNKNIYTARILFHFLKENSNFFPNAINFVDFDLLIKIRMKEVDEFENYIKNMKLFVQFCVKFNDYINVSKYEKLLNELNSLQTYGPLILYCQILPVENLINDNILKSHEPNITYFTNINMNIMKVIDQLVSLDRSKCVIFDRYFKETLQETNSKDEIENIIVTLWTQTLEKWRILAQSIESQSIKLNDLDKLYSDDFNHVFNRMEDEIKYLVTHFQIKSLNTRMKQITLWHKFTSSYDAAKAIHKIKNKLSLTNNFMELNDLLQISDNTYLTWKLDKMNDKIEKTVQCLEIMNNRANLECLIAFSESLQLVNWLRENIKGLNQLKTLVDSLSISAALDKTSQGSNRIVLARTLREAGTAYAALIYELKPNDDFTQFMKLCSKACAFLESDSKIANKLLIVSDKVSEFEQVLKQTESAERNSLKIAKDLNQQGVYVVKTKTGNEDSIDKLITLELKATESVYTYEDLKDLQNVLLLIAPRSDANSDDDKELKYFIQMLESITQLAIKYLRLIQYGCVYFDQFEIEIKCDISNIKDITDRCKINSFSKKNLIKDSLNTSLDYTAYLNKYLESAFLIWSGYINDLRNKYDCLNYFTIKQLKHIIRCLKINKNKLECNSFDVVREILFNLDPNLTLDKLTTAFQTKFTHESRDYQFEIDFKLKNLTFMQTLELEWIKYLNDQNATYLSLNQLAFLFDLIKIDNRIKRIIPGYLNHRGEPNLIKCTPNNQLSIVMSIYSCSIDEPMPTNDEILYCDNNTTYEEVEIFLRRVFKSTGERIYTILNVQDLRYETTNKLETFLLSNQQIHKTDSFVLVFVSCANSIITSLFAKNLISPIVLSDSEIYNYFDLKIQTKNRIFTLNPHNEKNKSYSVKGLLSQRSGNGKSTYVKELIKQLNNSDIDYKIIRIKSFKLDINAEIEKLFSNANRSKPTIYHIDLAHEVFHNVDQYLFNLIVCGYLKHSVTGLVWRRDTFNHLYLIEMSPPFYTNRQQDLKSYHSMLNYIPRVEFKTPRMYLYSLINEPNKQNETELNDNLFNLFYDEIRYQRCVYYLQRVARLKEEERTQKPNNLNGVVDYTQDNNLNDLFKDYYDPILKKFTQIEILETLFNTTKLGEPNWHELNNFVAFLDQQLNIYEQATLMRQVTCLKSLVVQLLCVMSNDFGLPSLNVNFNFRKQEQNLLNRSLSQASAFEVTSDLNINISLNDLDINEERRWEKMVHPYIIFNADGETLIFLGTCMDRETHKFINPQTGEFLEDESIPRINRSAFMELISQKTGIFENFNRMVREKKLDALSKVMGLDVRELMSSDRLLHRQVYELTLDNCLKMMAIYLRFRANTPAIIMGETGCGKTSLIKYFAFLNLRQKFQKKNLLHLKIHGGTTAEQIEKKLHEAEKLSEQNYKLFEQNKLIIQNKPVPITTILFLDEANTTEAIGLIKEIMCDLTCNGKPIELKFGLKIVAAVNPYKKHSDAMIKKLDQAGLGFYVSSNETRERLGQIPMRQLVYRVQPLPTSLLPIVWDFGRLNIDIERIYIKQMLISAIDKNQFGEDLIRNSNSSEQEVDLLCTLIVQSQLFMRSKDDECSFVSIRDVERVIKVTSWFLNKKKLIFSRMNQRKINHTDDSYQTSLKDLYRAFILALTVCYHSCLFKTETRLEYRQYLENIMKLDTNQDWIQIEIQKCQNIFMDEIDLEQMNNIARNSALLENVFMMIICIELRIPLFIVGKPGSSKSLAKSIVSRAMIGRNSKSELYQNLKETYFVNFQCSPLTTSEMIVKAFREAAEFQQHNDLNRSVSVVNLDEIGLAEGSESMPLKTLHSLLEDGACDDTEKAEDYHRVAVIGISNWALDPAKMNRGLFVARGEVTIEDLISSAEGICNYDRQVYDCIKPHINQIADAYLDLCQQASIEIKREFFGLRDYYSLIKMLYWFARNDRELKWSKLELAVKRNFNGVNIDIVEPFRTRLFNRLTNTESFKVDLIKSALKSEHSDSNSRYLLFLTENSSAIDIIQTYLTNNVGLSQNNLTIIFGSSFKNDLQYSEVCRNISLIKYCMEVGKTVILLNSYNLYESLYDALNQYYYELHKQKFVDLGLGTHRIKCAVHENFRLIVIAEKSAVYDSKRFPIPLINRLEKHFLNAATMLNKDQIDLRDQLDEWCKKLAGNGKLNETFIGLHDDTTSVVVLNLNKSDSVNILSHKSLMLQCATPDSIVRYCGNDFISADVRDQLWNDYFQNQSHLSLIDLIRNHLNQQITNLIQITTHSKLTLSSLDRNQFEVDEICLLKSFDTQSQFDKKLEEFFSSNQRILLIQAEFDQTYSNDLVSCARHVIVEKFKLNSPKNKFLFLLINIPNENVKNFIGYQLGYWSCYHIDEIESESDEIPHFKYLKNKSISDLLAETLRNETNMKLSMLLKRLAHNACSLIVDTNLERTIHRIDLFTHLCDSNNDFVNAIVVRLIGLLKEKEKYMHKPNRWLFSEAASLKTIKEYSTLRRACKNCFESKLSPLLAYLLAYLDQYSNMDIYSHALLNGSTMSWKADLWLGLSKNFEICKLNYVDMRVDVKTDDHVTNEEMKKFECQSDWLIKSFQDAFDENKSLKPMLPFFWILVNQLNNLYDNFIESVSAQSFKNNNSNELTDSDSLKNYENTISSFLEDTRLYTLLNEVVETHHYNNEAFVNSIIESYVNDFVLFNCAVTNNKELNLIKRLLIHKMKNLNIELVYKSVIKFTLPIVHYVYHGIKSQIDAYLQYSKFESEITNLIDLNHDIHFQAAIETINLFKNKRIDYFYDEYNQDKSQEKILNLCALINLTNNTMNQYDSNENEYKKIKEQYELLSVLLLFIDNMTTKTNHKNQILINKLNELKTTLLKDYFDQGINLKKKDSFKQLQDFIVYTYGQLSDLKTDDFSENLNIFYFNTIEYLVFNNQIPDDDTIDLILKSITDKQMTILNSKPLVIEQTYRSLLIQLIFKNYNQKVITHLKQWFNESILIGPNNLFESLNELANLFLNCVYDQFVYDIQANNRSLINQIKLADSLCIDLTKNLKSFIHRYKTRKAVHINYDVTFLIELARLKFCLSTMARVCYSSEVYDQYANETYFKSFNQNLSTILMETFGQNENDLQSGKSDTFMNYLLKELIRKYGSSSVKYVLSKDELKWMTPKSIMGDQEFVTDKYVLCPHTCYYNDSNENKYLKYKKLILECFERKNLEPINKLIETDKNNIEHTAYLGLSLYHNVTLLYKSIETSVKQIVEYFEPLEPRQVFKSMLSNSFEHNLKITQENWKHIDLNLLLIQIKFCVLFSPVENDLLNPLRDLIENPINFVEKYLPTMSQDTIYDIREIIQGSAMYVCPNGHRYVIGDCTRPWVTAKCNECGTEIGGTNHVSAVGNVRIDEVIDKTIRGYSLPRADQLDNKQQAERLLNTYEFQIERFFLHACLYLACGDENEKASNVKQLIKLEKPENVKQFFWNHMQKDLKITCETLNLTTDELILLLHMITYNFMLSNRLTRKNLKCSFDTKMERLNWEDEFNRTFMRSYLTDIRDKINDANTRIQAQNQSDKESQQSKVYFMAYELLKGPFYKSYYLYEDERFWKFRATVTFELMAIDLMNTSNLGDQFKILKKFIELKSKLKLAFHLPNIIRLISFLNKKLFRSIFKHTAQNKSIGQYINEINLPKDWTIADVQNSLDSFQAVWSYGKQNLKEYAVNNITNMTLFLQSDYEFNMNSKLSQFLPTKSGDGMFSYSLISFLCSIHNEMISFYRHHRQINKNTSELYTSQSLDYFENKNSIIEFDENNDLFRLVQANFTYDLKNLKCVYKFNNIESQLINRYLRFKYMINTKKIQFFEYSDEINDLIVFKKLEYNDLIDLVTQYDINDEFKKINEVSEALNILKVVINYASVLSAKSEESISSFIRKIYSNEFSLVKQAEQMLKSEIVEKCQLRHLKHIWLLLMMKKSILYTNNNQDPFDYLKPAFKVDMDFEHALNMIDTNSLLISLLLVLYQIIAFDLTDLSQEKDIDVRKSAYINTIFKALDDYSDFILPENIRKLPESFPDPIRDSGDDIEMLAVARVENIYALWKVLCKRIN